jgi:3-dehydroquinate synthase
LQRTSHDKNRPLLQTPDPKARIEELARQRGPLYQEVAHITLETGRPNVQSVVQTILARLEPLTTPVIPASDSAPTTPSL